MKAEAIAEKPWDDVDPEKDKMIRIVNKDEMMGTTIKFMNEIK